MHCIEPKRESLRINWYLVLNVLGCDVLSDTISLSQEDNSDNNSVDSDGFTENDTIVTTLDSCSYHFKRFDLHKMFPSHLPNQVLGFDSWHLDCRT